MRLFFSLGIIGDEKLLDETVRLLNEFMIPFCCAAGETHPTLIDGIYFYGLVI